VNGVSEHSCPPTKQDVPDGTETDGA